MNHLQTQSFKLHWSLAGIWNWSESDPNLRVTTIACATAEDRVCSILSGYCVCVECDGVMSLTIICRWHWDNTVKFTLVECPFLVRCHQLAFAGAEHAQHLIPSNQHNLTTTCTNIAFELKQFDAGTIIYVCWPLSASSDATFTSDSSHSCRPHF